MSRAVLLAGHFRERDRICQWLEDVGQAGIAADIRAGRHWTAKGLVPGDATLDTTSMEPPKQSTPEEDDCQ